MEASRPCCLRNARNGGGKPAGISSLARAPACGTLRWAMPTAAGQHNAQVHNRTNSQTEELEPQGQAPARARPLQNERKPKILHQERGAQRRAEFPKLKNSHSNSEATAQTDRRRLWMPNRKCPTRPRGCRRRGPRPGMKRRG